MARQDAGFIDKHIEKVVLGLCALMLLGSAWYAFMGSRFALNGLDPDQLSEQLATAADSTARAVLQAKASKPDRSSKNNDQDPVVQLKKWFGSHAEGLVKIAGVQSPVKRVHPFPPKFLSTTETALENRHQLARIVRPAIPIVTSGHTGFLMPDEKPELVNYNGPPPTPGDGPASMRYWVAVASQVDLIQQDINFISEQYPPGSFPFIVKVYLQRMDESALWRGWQEVDTFLPFKSAKRPKLYDPSSGLFKLNGLAAFRNLIESKQQFIARPQLPQRLSADKIRYPAVPYFPDPPPKDHKDIDKQVRQWMSTAKRARTGRRPFSSPDYDAAYLLLRAVIGSSNAKPADVKKARSLLAKIEKPFKKNRSTLSDQPIRPPERLMPLIAYDMNVIPGHQYRYRMRYDVYNTFAGNRGELRNPSDAEKLTVFSDWSPVSAVVKIRSNIQFFLTKANSTRGEVVVSVHKKSRSGWKQQDFKIHIGDEIGGKRAIGRNKGTDFSTHAVCVDIDFNHTADGGSRTVSLVYADTSDGSLHERILSVDRKADDNFSQRFGGRKTARR